MKRKAVLQKASSWNKIRICPDLCKFWIPPLPAGAQEIERAHKIWKGVLPEIALTVNTIFRSSTIKFGLPLFGRCWRYLVHPHKKWISYSSCRKKKTDSNRSSFDIDGELWIISNILFSFASIEIFHAKSRVSSYRFVRYENLIVVLM